MVLAIVLFSCSKTHTGTTMTTDADYRKAESLLYKRNDSAFYYYNKVVSGAKDSLLIAMAYSDMAAMQSDAGDYFGSQENLLTALHYLHEGREKDQYCLTSAYNELGNTNLNLKRYAESIDYYDQALRLIQDDVFKLIAANNKAVAYQKEKDYAHAVGIYDSILNKSKKYKKEYARILSNRARTKWLQDSSYNAAPELLAALQIRTEEQDLWGQNASYAHLSDYYAHTRQDAALRYANKMYATASTLQSPDDEMEALQKLIMLDDPRNVKPYFARYQFLNDSLQTARSNAKNQFALIRYNAEKNKTENLKLQKENADKKLQILRQRLFIYGTIFITLIAIVCAIFWYRKRREKIALETQNAIREGHLKTSQKVHDVVANGLYRIMTEVEHNPVIEKENLLDKIEVLYERSRNISYEPLPPAALNFQDQVASLLGSFASDTTKVATSGNKGELWEGINTSIQQEVVYILQELMVNMKKHSQARNVFIAFRRSNNQITIRYTDDGIGLKPQDKQGNGLTSTGNRIANMRGEITFDANTKTGLKILISFPIA